MERQEALELLFKEVRRLNEEEHVNDLCKAKRYDELSKVECRICNALMVFLKLDYNFGLRTEEISEGDFLATAMLDNIIGVCGFLEDDEEFVAHLAQEAGELGKSIAWKVYEHGVTISVIPWEEFFDDSFAKEYDDEYGIE